MDTVVEVVNLIDSLVWGVPMLVILLGAHVFLTVRTGFVQRKLPTAIKLSVSKDPNAPGDISQFGALCTALSATIGTGNIVGVGTAILAGGPGAVFWMWVIAFFGAATAFVESTLGQLFKVRGTDSFRGGPAYYIQKGMHCRWFAVLFAIIITLTFGLAFCSVQANTVAMAAQDSFGWSPIWVGVVLSALTLAVVWGGIQRISKFSEIVVPVMALAYIVLALIVILLNAGMIPDVLRTIVYSAFNGDAAIGATVGSALMLGIKRGLFSNEAGEGSAPNVAATASTTHPVKQGLIQALGVYTDTFLVCTSTAFIILWSGLYDTGSDGIVLTQAALESEVGPAGKYFVSVAIFLFAYTSIISNYYYGETNLNFIRRSKAMITIYRLSVGAIVFVGSVVSLQAVWAAADLFMALMTLINLTALAFLGRYAVRCLSDYRRQLRKGVDPVYRRSSIPEIASETECWPE